MKKIFVLFLVFLSYLSFSQDKASSQTDVSIDTENSNIHWEGYKVLGEHSGIVNFKSGTIMLVGNNIIGGEFIIDMSSIKNTDLEGEWKVKLEDHLKSDDFFGVDEYPTSKLVFKSVVKSSRNSYLVKANLSIRDVTKEIKFKLISINKGFIAKINIDRTEYNVNYSSGSLFDNLADKTIFDEFDVQVRIRY